MNLIDVTQQFKTDDDCLAYLESMRWPDGIRCPVCGCDRISTITRKNGTVTRGKTAARPGRIGAPASISALRKPANSNSRLPRAQSSMTPISL